VNQAVILAAGLGERLADVLPDRPKGFLELSGAPIITRSIDQLKSIGIDEIVIVTGFAASYYQSLAKQHPEVTLVHNEHFADSGSMFSLFCARGNVSGSFLLLESDLIYETRALEVIVESRLPNVLLGSGQTDSGDEVYLEIRDDSFVKMSKRRDDLLSVSGELVGITKVSPEMFDAMIGYAAVFFEKRTRLLHYEDCINAIADVVHVSPLVIEDLVWSEIDTEQQLKRVEQLILPKLSKNGQASSSRFGEPSEFTDSRPTAVRS
jgi:choline kinase